MDAEEAASRFGRLFVDVYRYCYRRQSPRVHRLSPESLALLDHLWRSGPLTVQEAAAHFDRSQAATSEMLDRMVRRGLLDRVVDERDRRRHLVWLTDEGLARVRRERQPLSAGILSASLARMTARDRHHLVNAMEKLVDAAMKNARATHAVQQPTQATSKEKRR